MKTNALILFTVLFLLSSGFTACSDSDILLSFTQDSYHPDDWDLEYEGIGNVVLVNNEDKLKEYFLFDEYPTVDFSKQTLLLVSGRTNYVIGQKSITNFRQKSKGEYELNVEIQLTFLTAFENWVMTVVTDKINDNSRIKVNVNLKN